MTPCFVQFLLPFSSFSSEIPPTRRFLCVHCFRLLPCHHLFQLFSGESQSGLHLLYISVKTLLPFISTSQNIRSFSPAEVASFSNSLWSSHRRMSVLTATTDSSSQGDAEEALCDLPKMHHSKACIVIYKPSRPQTPSNWSIIPTDLILTTIY